MQRLWMHLAAPSEVSSPFGDAEGRFLSSSSIHPLLWMMVLLRTTIINGDVNFWGESLPTSLPDLYKYPEQRLMIRLKQTRFFDYNSSNRGLLDSPRWIAFTKHRFTHVPLIHRSSTSTMTLNKGDKLRNLDRRRGSMPFPMNLPNLHRRSMPVDDRDLRATMPQTGQTDELSNLLRCTSYSPSEQHRGSCASDSSDSVISTGSEPESPVHKVVLLGEHGVGKSSLAGVFGGVEDAGHDWDEAGNTYDRSIVVDEEESSIVLYDIWEQDNSQWLQDQCMRMGDAYIIVYSVTDKSSFEKASELRIQLRRARQSENIPIILVGNKSDLVRSREVSVDEGSACAVVFDCKFIETSASLHHNVHDLFEGIVRQIRLRKDSKEENARRMANCRRRESIGKKAKRFLGRMVARKNKKMAFRQKSKSCHDLTVL